MVNSENPYAFACSIFKKEIEYLIEKGRLADNFKYIDSELHMKPQQLDKVLSKLVRPNCLLCYGDCHSGMTEQENRGDFTRIEGLNCVEIFLGKELYRKLRREGAFFLLPEWTCKWERIFKDLLGFNEQKLAIQFMNEMHKKFIFVDTGVTEVPGQILNSISEYFNLPVEILSIDLNNLETTIIEGLMQLKK